MTTTAATTSASPSTSNDSPPIQDDNVNSRSPTTIGEEKRSPNHQKLQQNQMEQLPQQLQQAHLQQQQLQQSPTSNSSASSTPTTPSPPPLSSQQPSTNTITTNTSSDSAETVPTEDSLRQPRDSPQLQRSDAKASNNNARQKRPMNAFLLYCKRYRSSVREKYPNLENRGITKILGDWWTKLDKEKKDKYTELARQRKEAFLKANPNFKWCKTPSVSNNINNNNNNSSNNITTKSNDYYPNNNHQQQHNYQQQHLQRHPQQSHHSTSSATDAELLSLQSAQNHLAEVVTHHSSNSMDITLTSRQQLEAPKPPKKRFLERNDPIYTARNNFSSNHDSNSHGTDVVPYISLDQDTLDRVIDKAFSEESSNSPSGNNTCKCSNRTSTNLTTSMGTNPTSFSSSSTSAHSTSIDEPVDFSMNRTINATRQQIINNLVEKMLSGPSENSSSFPRINGTDSFKGQTGLPVKKDNPDDT